MTATNVVAAVAAEPGVNAHRLGGQAARGVPLAPAGRGQPPSSGFFVLLGIVGPFFVPNPKIS